MQYVSTVDGHCMRTKKWGLFFFSYALMLSYVNSLHTLNVKVQQEVFCGNTYYCSGCNRRLKDHFLHLNILLFCCQSVTGTKREAVVYNRLCS